MPARSVADDLPRGAHHVPVAAVVICALAGRVTGIGIAQVGIQRPAMVGDDGGYWYVMRPSGQIAGN